MPKTLENKPRFDDEREAFAFLHRRRSKAEITKLVAAVQMGSAVAQAFSLLPKLAPVAAALVSPPGRPPPLLRVKPKGTEVSELAQSARTICNVVEAVIAASSGEAVATCRTLMRSPHYRLPAKRLLSLASEPMMIALFAATAALDQRVGRLEPSEMDALVQLSGVRDPGQEFQRDPRKRRQRSLVWKTTLKRAAKLKLTLKT